MLYQKRYRRFIIEQAIKRVYDSEIKRLASLLNTNILMGENSCIFYILSEHIKLKRYYDPILMGKKIYEYLFIHKYNFSFIRPFKFVILF